MHNLDDLSLSMETGIIAFGILIPVIVCYEVHTSCVMHMDMLSDIMEKICKFNFSGLILIIKVIFKSPNYCVVSGNTALQTAC